jgi:hypothetical protein
MKIEIKGYRSCRGMEDNAYSYTLWCEGRNVADVHYEGTGGPVFFRWKDESAKAPMQAFAQPLAVARAETQEAATRAKVGPGAEHPQGLEWGWWPDHLRKDAQAALEDYLFWMQENKAIMASLKRRMKKNVLVVRAGQAPGEYLAVSVAPTPENIARIAAREKKATVLNTLPESAWFAVLGI